MSALNECTPALDGCKGKPLNKILILDEIKLYMERLQTTPRFGEFGDDESGSDFVFVAK